MPFEHAATIQWGRWLRRVFAARPPNMQVLGQTVEDSLRATLKVADLTHLTTPVGWAQAGVLRNIVAGGVGTLSRFELHCLAPGGLWVDVFLAAQNVTMEIAEVPLGVTDRVGVQDYGTIPTVSQIAGSSPAEGLPAAGIPLYNSVVIQEQLPRQFFVPSGKVFLLRRDVQNSGLLITAIHWREIPAPEPR